jgi:nucleotide-binding universal stress UspA family protein
MSNVPKKILVGTDGSATAAQAVAKAAAMAGGLGADLVIVSAYSIRAPGGSGSDAAWSAAAEQAANAHVARAVEEARSAGAKEVSGTAVAGDPSDALVSEAERQGADLLVVGSKGMQSSARFFLGSVPNKVSHHAPCDLLIVHTSD